MNLSWMGKSVWLVALAAAAYCADANVGSFIVTNDDVALSNTATFHALNADGTLGSKISVATGGGGAAGGFFAASRVVAMPNSCVYVSNSGTGDIAGINAATHTVTGNFFGSNSDAGTVYGIGLAANGSFLYATYTDTSTIGTFRIQSGCTLAFLGDVFAIGSNNGVIDGMAIRGAMMVVTYGDGSIESFDISGGVPVSHGDLQYSTGSNDDELPNGVVITQNGHYAIFGDASVGSVVEVSDISSGKLTQTKAYWIGGGFGSSGIRLSPDESVLYVTNDSSGQLTAAFFDKNTGAITPGCKSPTLNGFYTQFVFSGRVGLQSNQGTGGIIYYPEYNATRSYIGMLQYASGGTTCTLTEAPHSPVADPGHNASVISLAVHK